MHLLVPGAYRPYNDGLAVTVEKIESQCTFWCRVLTDQCGPGPASADVESQCTFWCRVLTDADRVPNLTLTIQSQCTFWCRVLTDHVYR